MKKSIGKKVILRDVKTDRYGRIMALVYVDGLLVNEFLIKNGLAASSREGGEENEKIKAANDFARENRLGIFSSDCYQAEPLDSKCPIKGNINDVTKEKEYFVPACRHYSKVIVEKHTGETWFCSEKGAREAGFTLQSDCFRP